jgi:hypothetical protein
VTTNSTKEDFDLAISNLECAKEKLEELQISFFADTDVWYHINKARGNVMLALHLVKQISSQSHKRDQSICK